jgi:hypothetical protein
MIVEAPQRASRPGRSPIYSQPKAETRAFSPGAVQSLWIVIGRSVRGRQSEDIGRDDDLVRGELQIDSQRTPGCGRPIGGLSLSR